MPCCTPHSVEAILRAYIGRVDYEPEKTGLG